MNTCLFRKISVCSRVFVECITYYYAIIIIFSLDNAKMNNASWIFWWPKFHSIDKFSVAFLISHTQYYSSITSWDNQCNWLFIANTFLLPFGWMHLKRQTCYWYHAGLGVMWWPQHSCQSAHVSILGQPKS